MTSSPPRVLRVIILLLSVAACTSLVYDRRVYDIDRFNGYISFALMGSYFFSLVCQYSLVNKITRAFLMILLAFVWLTVNTSWAYTRYLHNRDMFRTDVNFSFPTSLLIVVEAILTLRYEAQVERSRQDQESGISSSSSSGGDMGFSSSSYSNQAPPPAYRQTQEMSTVTIPVGVLPPTVLPPDERDNVEITISPIDPTPVSSLSRATGQGKGTLTGQQPPHHQIPARAYFPPSSTSSSSGTSSSSSQSSRRNREIPGPGPEDLPPYSRA